MPQSRAAPIFGRDDIQAAVGVEQSRWRSRSSRARLSCWPWTSMSRSPSGARWRRDRQAVDVGGAAPCGRIRRVRIKQRSSIGPPRIASRSVRRASLRSNTAAARASSAGADQVGRRLAPQDQPQGRQQQALARPGLARPGAVSPLEAPRGRPRSARGSAPRVRGALVSCPHGAGSG